ncbi:hypothetical protein R3P38DRAFT_3378449 [Favolaschia claudopus]|uniref:Uncharacterized protein n=1 Tax=Favolaschia claudopus TaxID=2862362 RepID=A0AAV9Z8G9_9AGAR
MFATIALLPLILSLSVRPAHVSSPCTVVNGVIIAEGGSGCSYGPVNPPARFAVNKRATQSSSCTVVNGQVYKRAERDSGAFQDALANDPDLLNKIKAALGQVGDLASQAAQSSTAAGHAAAGDNGLDPNANPNGGATAARAKKAAKKLKAGKKEAVQKNQN